MSTRSKISSTNKDANQDAPYQEKISENLKNPVENPPSKKHADNVSDSSYRHLGMLSSLLNEQHDHEDVHHNKRDALENFTPPMMSFAGQENPHMVPQMIRHHHPYPCDDYLMYNGHMSHLHPSQQYFGHFDGCGRPQNQIFFQYPHLHAPPAPHAFFPPPDTFSHAACQHSPFLPQPGNPPFPPSATNRPSLRPGPKSILAYLDAVAAQNTASTMPKNQQETTPLHLHAQQHLLSLGVTEPSIKPALKSLGPNFSNKPPVKLACNVCIRGHRAPSCKHYDRPLFVVRPRGRPSVLCHKCLEKNANCRCQTDKTPSAGPYGVNIKGQGVNYTNQVPENLYARINPFQKYVPVKNKVQEEKKSSSKGESSKKAS